MTNHPTRHASECEGSGPCPYCSTPMKNTGAPIWEDFCPNRSCNGHREEFKALMRSGPFALGRKQRLEEAAPDMLAALRLGVEYDDILRKYQGPAQVLFDGDMKEIDAAYDRWVAAARAAIARAEGRP